MICMRAIGIEPGCISENNIHAVLLVTLVTLSSSAVQLKFVAFRSKSMPDPGVPMLDNKVFEGQEDRMKLGRCVNEAPTTGIGT